MGPHGQLSHRSGCRRRPRIRNSTRMHPKLGALVKDTGGKKKRRAKSETLFQMRPFARQIQLEEYSVLCVFCVLCVCMTNHDSSRCFGKYDRAAGATAYTQCTRLSPLYELEQTYSCYTHHISSRLTQRALVVKYFPVQDASPHLKIASNSFP